MRAHGLFGTEGEGEVITHLKAEDHVARVVALGASNLTRAFPTVLSIARSRWGCGVEVLAALGHGRSYGSTSTVFVRTLPGILQSGLWQQLKRLPPVPTRALITDIGNDILYGSSATQILAWIEECVGRLGRITSDIVLTDLPLANFRTLSRGRFLIFRSILFPRCRLSLEQGVEAAEQVSEGLATLAAKQNLCFLRPRAEWYGLDPIHIRSSWRHLAWREILSGEADRSGSAGPAWLEALRLYLLLPERQWVLGLEQVRPQTGVALRSGGRVWLY